MILTHLLLIALTSTARPVAAPENGPHRLHLTGAVGLAMPYGQFEDAGGSLALWFFGGAPLELGLHYDLGDFWALGTRVAHAPLFLNCSPCSGSNTKLSVAAEFRPGGSGPVHSYFSAEAGFASLAFTVESTPRFTQWFYGGELTIRVGQDYPLRPRLQLGWYVEFGTGMFFAHHAFIVALGTEWVRFRALHGWFGGGAQLRFGLL